MRHLLLFCIVLFCFVLSCVVSCCSDLFLFLYLFLSASQPLHSFADFDKGKY